jgi:thiopeptide-type bacteriocin biosynthesis protein
VWKVQLDTYEREVERYGGPAGIELCEQLFHHDSEAVVELLRLAEDRADQRWWLALLGMGRLLDDLGLDLDARQSVLCRARDAARSGLRMDGAAAGRLGAKYRAASAALAGLAGPEWQAARDVLDRRAERNAAPAALLAGRAPALAGSLLHMHANRLLRAAHQTQEMVLYDFLHRAVTGQAARR